MGSQHPFWGNIFGRSMKESDATVNLLKNSPIFEDLSYFDLVKVSQLLHLRKYYKNEVIFREKELGTSLYIVKSGKVKIFSTSESGSERDLAILDSPSFFGEVSLIDEAPRSATAIAIEETEIFGFFRSDLLTLIDRNPRLSAFFLLHLSKALARRLRVMNKELNSTSI